MIHWPAAPDEHIGQTPQLCGGVVSARGWSTRKSMNDPDIRVRMSAATAGGVRQVRRRPAGVLHQHLQPGAPRRHTDSSQAMRSPHQHAQALDRAPCCLTRVTAVAVARASWLLLTVHSIAASAEQVAGSASGGGPLKGSAFWQWYDSGQVKIASRIRRALVCARPQVIPAAQHCPQLQFAGLLVRGVGEALRSAGDGHCTQKWCPVTSWPAAALQVA